MLGDSREGGADETGSGNVVETDDGHLPGTEMPASWRAIMAPNGHQVVGGENGGWARGEFEEFLHAFVTTASVKSPAG